MYKLFVVCINLVAMVECSPIADHISSSCHSLTSCFSCSNQRCSWNESENFCSDTPNHVKQTTAWHEYFASCKKQDGDDLC